MIQFLPRELCFCSNSAFKNIESLVIRGSAVFSPGTQRAGLNFKDSDSDSTLESESESESDSSPRPSKTRTLSPSL